MPDAGYTAVKTLLPLITPFKIENDTEGLQYYNLAVEQTTRDAPGLSETQAQTAQCYWIGHLMAGRDGHSGVTSEHLGQWSATYNTTAEGTDIYYAQYRRFLADAAPQTFSGISATVRHTDEITADNYSLDGFRSW
jgi:hypothetical protein